MYEGKATCLRMFLSTLIKKTMAFVAVTAIMTVPMFSTAAKHPLDSLTPDEFSAVMKILADDGRITNVTRVPSLSLIEPAKAFVKEWNVGETFLRRVTAVLKDGPTSYKAIVDLEAETVESFDEVDKEGMFLLEEILSATDLAVTDQAMIDGLAKRGFTTSDVFCLPLSAGSFGDPIEDGTRLMKVPCFVLPSGSNWYAKPIEGLFAFVDLNSKTVIEVVDTGVVTTPTDEWGYTADEIKERYGSLRGPTDTPPASISRQSDSTVPPTGTYSIEDSIVKWDIFSFHYRVDKRPGLVLSDIKVNDKGTIRDVMYQTHLSEVFVPYMDPDIGWFWRTYMDSGEYGFGIFMTPLSVGVDCPSDATYIGSTFHDDFGQPFTIPDSVCMFERSIGDPIWRHFEIFAQGDTFTPAEGRASTEFVVRYAAEIGNYDYLVDFIFMQDGTIKMGVGSTGIDAVKGVETLSMKDASAAADTAYGTLIAPHLVGVHHSHFFNFRMDLDVDGDANDFEKLKLVPVNITAMNISRTSMCHHVGC